MADPIVNLPGNLFAATLYPVGPMYLTIVSGNGVALPNLTAKAVLIVGRKRTVLPDNRQPTITRIGTDLMGYALEYPDVALLAEDSQIQGANGFFVEFAISTGEVIMRGSFTFSLDTTANDTDFDELSIILNNLNYFITVTLPLRSGGGGGGGGSTIIGTSAKAFALTNVGHNTTISHNFGAALGLTASQYVLELRLYEGTTGLLSTTVPGDFISGVTALKTTANLTTLSFADTSVTIPFAVAVLMPIPL